MAESNSVAFEKLEEFFGITHITTDRVPIPHDGIVFTTNIFIPMEGAIGLKTFVYLSGFVKMVETFQARTSLLKTDRPVYLHVYYDSMFDQEYDDNIYRLNGAQNNNLNTEIKSNYAKNHVVLKKSLSDYRRYLQKIKSNDGRKYDFVRLFSFNCRYLDKKKKGYLGHPDTFGSVVRLITLFDPRIRTSFSINGRNALTPRLCFLISKWLESEKVVFTSNEYTYFYNDSDIKLFYNYLLKINDDEYKGFISEFSDSVLQNESLKSLRYSRLSRYRPFAGLVGINGCNETTKQLIFSWFYKIMWDLLFLQSKYRKHVNPFQYGVDEMLLAILFNAMNVDIVDERIPGGGSLQIDEKLVYTFKSNLLDASLFQECKIGSFFRPSNDLFNGKELEGLNETFTERIPEKFRKDKNIIIQNLKINIQLEYTLHKLRDEEGKLNMVEFNKLIELIRSLRDEICKLYNEKNNKNDETRKFNTKQMNILCNGIINFKRFDNGHKIKEGYEFLSKLGLIKNFERHTLTTSGYEVSRKLFQELGEEEYVEDFLSNPDGKYSIITLLFCFDEFKPLHIFQNETYLNPHIMPFSEYNTKLFIGDPALVDKIVIHYSDPSETLPIPYRIKELPTAASQAGAAASETAGVAATGAAGGSSQGGGFKKNRKLTKKYKKTHTKRKSRHNKNHTHTKKYKK
jgi:hypothetical protein